MKIAVIWRNFSARRKMYDIQQDILRHDIQEMTWIDCQKDLFCCLFCFVVNTTVMYRDNPLAFWSETVDNSLNRYSYS